MAIVLGGVVLDDNVVWIDRDDFSPVAQETDRTLAGNLITFSSVLIGGRPVTLEATVERGWFTRTQKDAVKALDPSAAVEV